MAAVLPCAPEGDRTQIKAQALEEVWNGKKAPSKLGAREASRYHAGSHCLHSTGFDTAVNH